MGKGLFIKWYWESCRMQLKDAGDAEDMSLVPRLGRSPGGGNGNLFQYSCLENSMDRGACQAIVHGL